MRRSSCDNKFLADFLEEIRLAYPEMMLVAGKAVCGVESDQLRELKQFARIKRPGNQAPLRQHNIYLVELRDDLLELVPSLGHSNFFSNAR